MSVLDNGTLELEDLFEIITPSGIDSRLLSLDTAWQSLYSSNPDNTYIFGETSAWNKWRDKISSSYISKVFASGTLNELDSWKARYKEAFKRNSGTNAVSPEVFKEKDFGIPAWAFIAIGAGITLLSLYYLGRK